MAYPASYGSSRVPSPTREDLLGDERALLLPNGKGVNGRPRREEEEEEEEPSRVLFSWPWWKSRARYYVPATNWLPNYNLAFLLGDIGAALTVATVMVPLSMSYASSLAHLDPLAGLFAAAIQSFVYALLGSCKHLSVGPEASLSLLIGQVVTKILHDDPHLPAVDAPRIAIEVATITTFQVGLISFGLGLFRLGFIDVVLSRALLRGFVTAVSVVIVIEECVPMLGLAALAAGQDHHTAWDKLLFIIQHLSDSHRPTALMSLSSLAFLIVARSLKTHLKKRWRWLTFVPEVLICVIITTFLCRLLSWPDYGIEVLGPVAAHPSMRLLAPPLRPQNLQFFKATFPTAILISIIGFIDSVVAAKQNAQRFRYSVSPNRELVALGAGNLLASCVPSTLPAYGAITRSRLVADCGGVTQMSSAMLAGLVLLSIKFLLPAMYFLPKGVLAAVICLVVYTIIAEAPEEMGYYWKMSAWTDIGLMSLTFILTLFWSVEVGIAASVAVSLLLVVRQSSKQRIKVLGHMPGTDHWAPIDENPEAKDDMPGLLVVRIREDLNFANTGQIKERLRRLELYGNSKHHPSDSPVRHEAVAVVFQMADVEEIDASAVQIFLELAETYHERHVIVCFAHLRASCKELFERAGIVALLGENRFHPSVKSAVAFIETQSPDIERRWHDAQN